MKKVMVFGTFDILHPGHINFFKQAKGQGDYLIIVVARDLNVKKIKGKFPLNSEQTRMNEIKKTGIADEAVLGRLNDWFGLIEEKKPDTICLGYDQKDFNLKEELKKRNLNIEIIRLKPYKNKKYKSSKLKLQSKFKQITGS